LKPRHVLWLREVAGLLGEYFGWASASSMRDAQLAYDHGTTYKAMLAFVDSERHTALKELLMFVEARVKGAAEAPSGARSGSPYPHGGVDLSEGVTFVFMTVPGPVRLRAPEGASAAVRHLPRLREQAQELCRNGEQNKQLKGFSAAYYRTGVLVALQLASGIGLERLLGVLYRRFARCHDWLRASDSGGQRPPVAAFVFHRSFEELDGLGFGKAAEQAAEAGKEAAQHEASEKRLHQLLLALRRLDGTLHRFREEVERPRIAEVLGAGPPQGVLREDELVFYEDPASGEIKAFKPLPLVGVPGAGGGNPGAPPARAEELGAERSVPPPLG